MPNHSPVVLSVFGTRPEVIKMAPVIRELARRRPRLRSLVLSTGQHREMCRPYQELFEVPPDVDLAIMEPGQTLDGIVARICSSFPKVLAEHKPDIVLVQGDTTSAFAAALCAHHAKVKVGHVEAGLRTHNKYNPFPEEMNRRLIGALADIHFAPTASSRDNLLREGVPADRVLVTGNTVIDALFYLLEKGPQTNPLADLDFRGRRVVLVTTHRRESFGAPLRNTIAALRLLVDRFEDLEIIIPVHYNPNVREAIFGELRGCARVHLVDPMPYEQFVHVLRRADLVLTDSGGVQEEAPSLGKPVLVLRETTERPEGVTAGVARLVGTDRDAIVASASELLENPAAYAAMAQAQNPYGDGHAARRIADALEALLAV